MPEEFPIIWTHIQKRQLQRVEVGVGQARIAHLAHPAMILLEFDIVLSQRRGAIFDFQIALMHPDRDWLVSETIFPIKLPVLEAQIPVAVQMPGVARGEEDT